MINESYVECLVKAKPSLAGKVFTYVFGALTVGSIILALMGMGIGLITAVLFGGGAYFVNMFSDVEYEYLYVDKEITIDKIFARSNRKTIGRYALESMEIFAPVSSEHLADFKNREVRTQDFSAGSKGEGPVFAMYYEGGKRLLLSPSQEMIKVLKNIAPRKVFSE